MPKSLHLHKSSLYKQANLFLLIIPGVVFVFVLVSYFLIFNQKAKGQVAAARTESVKEQAENLEDDKYLERKLDKLQER